MRRPSAESGTRRPPKVAVINNPRVRGAAYQVALLVLLVWAGYEFALNAKANLEAQRIASGFGFLENTAGFGVNQSLIPYTETDSYGRVFVVGLLNTLLVASIGIVLATILGFIIGIARLSPNWLVARLAGGYVELVRNLPLLFQILFWYLAVLGALPGPRQSLAIGWQPLFAALAEGSQWLGLPAVTEAWRSVAAWVGPPEFFLNNRGLTVPRLIFGEGSHIIAASVVIAVIAAIVLQRWAKRRQDMIGARFPSAWTILAILVGVPLAASVVFGVGVSVERPELRGFNFVGGLRLIPEFVALLLALVIYTAAFIAEVVRAGILAVPRGQSEAALALGLTRGPMLRLVVVPQALRVIVPPLTNQYLNLTKNSSLAVAIGYPDLFALFAGTTLNQTHQAIEVLAITMAVYLAISLVTSLLMNWYNAHVRLSER
jgi:general L-amino acid transport system permease protein